MRKSFVDNLMEGGSVLLFSCFLAPVYLLLLQAPKGKVKTKSEKSKLKPKEESALVHDSRLDLRCIVLNESQNMS